MNKNMKNILRICGISIIIMMLVTAAPATYHLAGEQRQVSPVGESEAIAPLGIGLGVKAALAGGAVLGGGAIQAYHWYTDDTESSEVEEAIKAGEDVQNETLRQAVHSDAILSEGGSEDFITTYDNDLTFIESNVERVVLNKFSEEIQKAMEQNDGEIVELREIMSESEAVNMAENQTSNYLRSSIGGIVNTHNYHAYGVSQYNNRLDTVGFGGDIGAVKKVEISSVSEFEDIYSDLLNKNMYLDIQTDIDFTKSDKLNRLSVNNGNNPNVSTVFDLNGNTITTDGSFVYVSDDFAEINHEFRDGTISTNNSKIGDIRGGEYKINLIDVDTTDVNDTIASGVVGARGSYSVYDSNTDTGEKLDIGLLEKITFDASEVASVDSAYDNATDVPVHTYNISETEEVTLTAQEMSLDSSYSSEPAKIATPYNLDRNRFVDLQNESVLVETSTSGIADFAEPHKFGEYYDTIEYRDDRSAQAYQMALNYTSSYYQANQNKVVNEYADQLGALSVVQDTETYKNMTQRDLYAQNYVSSLEGTVSPHERGIVITNQDTNTTKEGALFVTDVEYLTNQTANATKFEQGDTFTVDSNVSGFLVSEYGDKQNLDNGDYVVDSMEGTEQSIDVRTFDQESTDFNEVIKRQQAQEDVLNDTLEKGVTINYPDVSDNTIYLILGTVLVGLWIATRNNGNNGSGGSRNYKN